MKTLSLSAVAMIVITAVPAYAAETPHKTAQDDRIREAVFSEAQVFSVVGVFRSATQIVFSSAERVEHVALGDKYNRAARASCRDLTP